MKILLLLIATTVLAVAQSVTNVTVSVNLNARELAAIESCLSAENLARTNEIPPRQALNQAQFLRLQFNSTLRDIVEKSDTTTRHDLFSRFTNAPPAKQQAALDALR